METYGITFNTQISTDNLCSTCLFWCFWNRVVCIYTACWTWTHSVAQVPPWTQQSCCLGLPSARIMLTLGFSSFLYVKYCIQWCVFLHSSAGSILQTIVLVLRERSFKVTRVGSDTVCIRSLKSFLPESIACSGIRKLVCKDYLIWIYGVSSCEEILFNWWMKLNADRKVLEGKSAGNQVRRSENGF